MRFQEMQKRKTEKRALKQAQTLEKLRIQRLEIQGRAKRQSLIQGERQKIEKARKELRLIKAERRRKQLAPVLKTISSLREEIKRVR